MRGNTSVSPEGTVSAAGLCHSQRHVPNRPRASRPGARQARLIGVGTGAVLRVKVEMPDGHLSRRPFGSLGFAA
jgi:hypothetical protein